MSVGGHIIEIKYTGRYYTDGRPIVRIWVVDGYDETCIYAVYDPVQMPSIWENIWWSSGRIYYDGDKRQLIKVGHSFQPRRRERAELT